MSGEDLLKDSPHFWVITAKRKYSPTRQQIEIAIAFGIVQPAALAADVVLIEPDGAQHFD
jgi:hypothetical protein